jgi:hypothetical protein
MVNESFGIGVDHNLLEGRILDMCYIVEALFLRPRLVVIGSHE